MSDTKTKLQKSLKSIYEDLHDAENGPDRQTFGFKHRLEVIHESLVELEPKMVSEFPELGELEVLRDFESIHDHRGSAGMAQVLKSRIKKLAIETDVNLEQDKISTENSNEVELQKFEIERQKIPEKSVQEIISTLDTVIGVFTDTEATKKMLDEAIKIYDSYWKTAKNSFPHRKDIELLKINAVSLTRFIIVGTQELDDRRKKLVANSKRLKEIYEDETKIDTSRKKTEKEIQKEILEFIRIFHGLAPVPLSNLDHVTDGDRELALFYLKPLEKKKWVTLIVGHMENEYRITKRGMEGLDNMIIESARSKQESIGNTSTGSKENRKNMLDGLSKLFKNKKSEKIYDAASQYDIYKYLKNLVKLASKEVFIVDGYVDETIFEYYLDEVPEKVPIKILTKKPSSKFLSVAKLLNQKRPLEIRISESVHDRYIFLDDKCWMLGASIKDAAKNSPTVMVEISGKKELYELWMKYFDKGNTQSL